MRMPWIVCWQGLEQQCASAQEALDCWDRLYASGIEARIFALVGARGTRIQVRN
jgi:hypothetical protein